MQSEYLLNRRPICLYLNYGLTQMKTHSLTFKRCHAHLSKTIILFENIYIWFEYLQLQKSLSDHIIMEFLTVLDFCSPFKYLSET